MAIACGDYFKSCLTSDFGPYLRQCGDGIDFLDDGIFKLGQYSAGLGQHISEIRGNDEAAHKCRAVSEAFDTARDAISSIRFIPAFHNLCTGRTFWHTHDDKWRKVAHQNGVPIIIESREGWTKKKDSDYWKNDKGWKSLDRKYIDKGYGQTGVEYDYVCRDWMDIAMEVLAAVARALSPVMLLHRLGAIDLGKHAKALGGVIMGIWTMITSISLVSSISDVIDEVDLEEFQRKVWEAIHALITFLALPFEFGLGELHPAAAVAGAVINLVEAASYIAKEAVHYG